MRLVDAVVVAVVVAGCATPYQRAGFRGGYSDEKLSPGRYAIEVNVNSYTSSGTALKYLHRRATELCPAGYDVVGAAGGSRDFYVRTGNTVQNMPKSEVSAVVQCRSPAEQAAKRVADSVVAWAPRTKHWCSETTDGALGFCDATAAGCERRRREVNASGTFQSCARRERVTCYDAESLDEDGFMVRSCAVTTAQCAWSLSQNFDGWAVAAGCRELSD